MAAERELSLLGTEVSEELLCALEANKDLESLTIWGGPLTNDRLAPLSRLTQLKALTLGEMPIDDGILPHLRNLRKLESLNLSYTRVEGDFTPLLGLSLREVRLEGCRRVGDRCAEILSRFSTLRQLEIHMTALTDEGVAQFAHAPLEVLWLAGSRITDAGMRAVGTMAELKHLDICSGGVTDVGLQAIAGLTSLEVLWLSQSRITDASIDILCRFTKLRELSVDKTGVTQAGKQKLRELLPGVLQ
jgi:internalin A